MCEKLMPNAKLDAVSSTDKVANAISATFNLSCN